MTLRDAQADAARKLIGAAALEVFLEHGYVGATMTDIAVRAGVARQTLYNLFDSKAALVLAAIADRVEGREQRSQADDHRRVTESTTAEEMIAAFAASTAGIAARALPILRIAREAAAVDGEVAKQLARHEEGRYQAMGFFVDALATKGFLRTDVPADDLKRGFWLLTSPESYLTAADAGWDVETYVSWLTLTVRGLLLPD